MGDAAREMFQSIATGKPLKWKRFIDERSPAMLNRYRSWERDANKVGTFSYFGFTPGTAINDAAYFFMRVLDGVTTYTSWLAGYRAGLKRFGIENEAKAIELADLIIRTSQGSGAPIEQSLALMGGRDRSEVKKLFTMFYTFFNTRYNQQVGAIRRLRMQPKRVDRAFESLLWLVILPPIIQTLTVRGKETTAADVGKAVALSPFSGIPVARDLASAIVYGGDYQLTPAAGLGESLAAAVTHIQTEDWERLAQDTMMVGGFAVGFPSKQATIWWDGIEDIEENRADSVLHLLWPEKEAIKKRRRARAKAAAKRRKANK